MMWVDGRDVRGHTTGGEPLTDVSWLLVLHADAGPIDPHPARRALRQQLFPGARHRHADRRAGRPGAVAGGRTDVIPGRTVWLLRADRSADSYAVVTKPSSAGEASSSCRGSTRTVYPTGAGPGQRQLRLVPVARCPPSNRCPTRRRKSMSHGAMSCNCSLTSTRPVTDCTSTSSGASPPRSRKRPHRHDVAQRRLGADPGGVDVDHPDRRPGRPHLVLPGRQPLGHGQVGWSPPGSTRTPGRSTR